MGPTTMRIDAAVLNELAGEFTIEALDLEAPRAHEVRVEIAGVGICHTDVKMARGYRPVRLPLVLGHEGSGTVVDVGSEVTKVRPGDRVVLSFDSCGACEHCQSGHPAVCDLVDELTFGCARLDGSSPLKRDGEVVHGCFFGQSSFSTIALATDRNTVRVDADAPLELLGPLGCGVQTGAGAVFNSLDVQPGTSLVVFGAGTVGLSAVMAARVVGAGTIVAVDRHPSRLSLAADLGATHTIDTSQVEGPDTLVAAVKAACGGGAHYALDTTNVVSLVEAAIGSLRVRGTYGHVGGGGTTIGVSTGHLLAGRTITGIIQGDSVPDVMIPRLIDLHRQGRFPFDRLVTFYEFGDINQAISDMQAGETVKPVLRPGGCS